MSLSRQRLFAVLSIYVFNFVFHRQLSDYELCIAANIVDTLTINMTWDDIGGLDSVIEEIKESVILPFRERQLFSDSVLLQPPKGDPYMT